MPWHPTLDELFDSCPGLEARLGGLRQAASSNAPILLLGEPGSGRSVLARAIHASSHRASRPLVEVDPGAIPASLFESELFGHRPGAFTGAEAEAEGRVARAQGGSLLLDHVENLPLASQPKLLRLLAERRYQPLGGAERGADVRFLAVASDELPERVARGAFRLDLFYRLEVLAFRVPPLRERCQDLRPLSAAMLAELAARLDREPPLVAEVAWEWMEEYSWPGNLRELRNLLERALVMDGGRDGAVSPPRPKGLLGLRPRSLKEVEEEEIRKALAFTGGHQGRASRLIGISRKALWEKRKRLGIP
jgi:DNA-binding NtrC family response regulator